MLKSCVCQTIYLKFEPKILLYLCLLGHSYSSLFASCAIQVQYLERIGIRPLKQSKLESFIEILKIFDKQNAQKLNNSIDLNEIYYFSMKESLDFLTKQGIIEKINTGKQIAYANTRKATSILRYFGELPQEILPRNSRL
jgi:predicted transcriptional regulator